MGGSHHKNGRGKNPPPQKKILNGKLHNRRSVGNPGRRWKDVAHRSYNKRVEETSWGQRRLDVTFEEG
jgi:hypothetical protein